MKHLWGAVCIIVHCNLHFSPVLERVPGALPPLDLHGRIGALCVHDRAALALLVHVEPIRGNIQI